MTKDRRAVWVAMEKLVPLVLKVFATHFLPHSLPGSWPGCSRTAADEPVLPAGRAPPRVGRALPVPQDSQGTPAENWGWLLRQDLSRPLP